MGGIRLGIASENGGGNWRRQVVKDLEANGVKVHRSPMSNAIQKNESQERKTDIFREKEEEETKNQSFHSAVKESPVSEPKKTKEDQVRRKVPSLLNDIIFIIVKTKNERALFF